MKSRSPVNPDSGNQKGNNASYTLIPKDARFELPHDEPEMTDKDATVHFDEKLQRLQKIFGYTNPHQSELETSFNVKPLFILGRAIPNSDAGEAIMLLVADKDLFFKDGDKIYRSKESNSAFWSGKKRLARELKKNGAQENSSQKRLIGLALQDWFHPPASEQSLMAEKILMAVINEAAASSIGVRRWLYSLEHAKVGTSNIDYYKQAYSYFPDGYYDPNRIFPEDEHEREDFISGLLKNPNPSKAPDRKEPEEKRSFYCRPEMLNVEVCKRDFECLVPECVGNPLCSIEFYERVIWCLHGYISLKHSIKTPVQEEEPYTDTERLRRNYGVFEKRYQRIRALANEFSHAPPSWTEQMEKNVPCEINVEQHSPQTPVIVNAIINYYKEIDIKTPNMRFLSARIEWILHPSEEWKFLDDDVLKPMLILALVLSFRGRMTQDSEIASPPAKAFHWSKRISKEKQRLAEIRLLDTLHTALNLPQDLQVESWNQYFLFQGKGILGAKELAFWRDKLQTNYEALPIIGFQLCFLDFCNDCMSPHCERLSYASIFEVRNVNFYEFYQSHFSEIDELSMCLYEHYERQNDSGQKLIKNYCKLWKSPKSGNEERRKAILPLRELLQNDSRLFDMSQSDEVLDLSIEAAIRLAVIKKAREKLASWFDKTYSCSIKKLQLASTPGNNGSVIET